jgi:hypothetical protein
MTKKTFVKALLAGAGAAGLHSHNQETSATSSSLTPPTSTTIDSSKTYILHNNWSGPLKLLSVQPSDHLEMVDRAPHPNQLFPATLWFFRSTDRPGYYRLHTLSGGESRALDVINDRGHDSEHMRMAAWEDVSGQFWRVDAWAVAGDGAGEGNEGRVRLSNLFTGDERNLDVYADGGFGPHLAGGGCIGQRWTLEPVNVW